RPTLRWQSASSAWRPWRCAECVSWSASSLRGAEHGPPAGGGGAIVPARAAQLLCCSWVRGDISMRRRAAFATLAGLVLVFGAASLSAPEHAAADVPPGPVEEFGAALCPGTTLDDPTDAAGPVSDLTLVFGQRLTDYSEGKVVPLYDVFGSNELNGYPAVCSV